MQTQPREAQHFLSCANFTGKTMGTYGNPREPQSVQHEQKKTRNWRTHSSVLGGGDGNLDNTGSIAIKNIQQIYSHSCTLHNSCSYCDCVVEMLASQCALVAAVTVVTFSACSSTFSTCRHLSRHRLNWQNRVHRKLRKRGQQVARPHEGRCSKMLKAYAQNFARQEIWPSQVGG